MENSCKLLVTDHEEGVQAVLVEEFLSTISMVPKVWTGGCPVQESARSQEQDRRAFRYA